MRTYESLYIVHPEVAGDELTAIVDKFQEILTAQQAEILKLDNWGVRKLAYPIAKQGRGSYVQVIFQAEPQVIAEYERRLRLDEKILRFLTVLFDGDIEAAHQKESVAEEAEVAEDVAAEDVTFEDAE
ncbi:MAG: 30S ribosomal protein S6 [Desulfuromonadales bacterium]|nr:30S ribosomal protein S6 [Desulfuromonadales bacterium]